MVQASQEEADRSLYPATQSQATGAQLATVLKLPKTVWHLEAFVATVPQATHVLRSPAGVNPSSQSETQSGPDRIMLVTELPTIQSFPRAVGVVVENPPRVAAGLVFQQEAQIFLSLSAALSPHLKQLSAPVVHESYVAVGTRERALVVSSKAMRSLYILIQFIK